MRAFRRGDRDKRRDKTWAAAWLLGECVGGTAGSSEGAATLTPEKPQGKFESLIAERAVKACICVAHMSRKGWRFLVVTGKGSVMMRSLSVSDGGAVHVLLEKSSGVMKDAYWRSEVLTRWIGLVDYISVPYAKPVVRDLQAHKQRLTQLPSIDFNGVATIEKISAATKRELTTTRLRHLTAPSRDVDFCEIHSACFS
ncbi:hypothetical protein Tco_0331580 [Tanacetum coccineum]